MNAVVSLSDVQSLYKQWQDGKLLNNEERSALRAKLPAERPDQTFADLLKRAAEIPSAG